MQTEPGGMDEVIEFPDHLPVVLAPLSVVDIQPFRAEAPVPGTIAA